MVVQRLEFGVKHGEGHILGGEAFNQNYGFGFVSQVLGFHVIELKNVLRATI